MKKKFFEHIVYGGDYNPDQWIKSKEIWDEDIRLMKKAHINSATVGIFSWSVLEPEEDVFDFSFLDEIMDKLYENGIDVILATPSGARPAWLAQKYPQVLRVNESGVRNEFGVRHNHCLTSPVYREKVRNINRKLAERYKNHPALKMWHISNEYGGECHCELCQQSFREWVKKYYNNSLEELNEKWWNGFWSHNLTDWSQINSPKDRGENHSSALKLCWNRFVSESHISFFKNEIAPLREITPDIPVTTNFMNMYQTINYQDFAKYVDVVSWDNYPDWEEDDTFHVGARTAFVHDVFRSAKNGQPFFMMESTPSILNWHSVNKIHKPGTLALTSVQAIAHGSDSVQYFQFRKSRGGHEKYHGAVVGHCGHENTRVFSEVSVFGKELEKLGEITGEYCSAKVAVICDWENMWAIKHYCGFNNLKRDYVDECIKWYIPFLKRGICIDVISMDSDFSAYDLIIAPWLYMLKDGIDRKTEAYVKNGGTFAGTYMTGFVDTDDRCFSGGFPGGCLKDVFGVWCEETDSLFEDKPGFASFNQKKYQVNHICDIIHSTGSNILGKYESDFYAGMPSVTENCFGAGKAYYVAFRNDGTLADDFCEMLCSKMNIQRDIDFDLPEKVVARKRGNYIFIMNFSDEKRNVVLDREYYNVMTGKTVSGEILLECRGYAVIK